MYTPSLYPLTLHMPEKVHKRPALMPALLQVWGFLGHHLRIKVSSRILQRRCLLRSISILMLSPKVYHDSSLSHTASCSGWLGLPHMPGCHLRAGKQPEAVVLPAKFNLGLAAPLLVE